MDPGTWMMIASAVSAVGAIQQGVAASDAASYNSKVAQQNAEAARQQGVAAQEQQARNAKRQQGALTAAYSASGVDSSQGSPLDVLQDSVRQSTYDNLSVKYKYDMGATSYSNQSDLLESQASSATTAGLLKAGGYVASGMGKVAGMGGGNDVANLYGISDGKRYDNNGYTGD